jgi:glutathione S-transferase
VRICLAEKKLEWESRHVDIVNKRDNSKKWYLKINSNGVVPTLEHDGRIVIESNIILEYLDDSFPDTRLKPNVPFQISKMRLWLDRAETIVHKNVNVLSWNRRHIPRMKHLSHEQHLKILEQFPNPETRMVRINRLEHGVSDADEEFSKARLSEFMDAMEGELNGNTWLAGESFSLADIAIAPFIERFEANNLDELIDFRKRPKIGSWWKKIKSRESFRTAYAFKNPDD